MNFNIGLAALRASQFAIDTVSQNLANANTVGYHRQRVGTIPELPCRNMWEDRFIGSGVEIGSVDRFRNQIVESSLTISISDLSNVTQRLSIESQIEGLFQIGDGIDSQPHSVVFSTNFPVSPPTRTNWYKGALSSARGLTSQRKLVRFPID